MKKLYLLAGSAIILIIVVALWARDSKEPETSDIAVEAEATPLLGASCMNHDGQPWNFAEGTIQINNNQIPVAVADSPEEREKGLGNCEALPENAGMYFVIEPAKKTAFWMKDTLIPLDIIWIAEGKVVGINQEVQPEPGVADAELKRYQPDVAVDGVIELAAGQADKLGITVGSELQKSF